MSDRLTLLQVLLLPVLDRSHTDNLIRSTPTERTWVSRMTVDDGATCDHMVTVERLMDGRWVVVDTYEPEAPTSVGSA